MTLAIIIGAILLSATTYVAFERLGRKALLPAAARAVAWTGLGLLVFNVSCPAPGVERNLLILIDGSLSMRADSAGFARLTDSAVAAGDVVFFGDERGALDSLPRGRSRLADPLRAAVVTGRPVKVITDGEVEDGIELGFDLLAGVEIDVRPRLDTIPIAITQVRSPGRVTAGDTLVIEGMIRTFGREHGDSVSLEVAAGDLILAQTSLTTEAAGRARFRAVATTRGLPPGEHVLTVRVVGDGPPSVAGIRWRHISVVPTPGIVLLADPGNWDSKFLYRTLVDVADLPVRGYVKPADQWRSMADLAPVSEATVRRASRGADLLILMGHPGDFADGSRARAVWRWPGGGEAGLGGDWYLAAGSPSPVARPLAGIAVDSFPPATNITPIQAEDDEWVGLQAQAGRRGALRPVIVGGERGRRRHLLVAADGLWRWVLPGGSSEQGYRSLMAAMTSWALAGTDSLAGAAVPVLRVAQNARPLVFRWVGQGEPVALPIRFDGGNNEVADTLRFDGSGRGRVWLPVGRYRYTMADGATGMVAVEPYSAEWLPRAVTLQPQAPGAIAAAARTSAREMLWLFGLVVAALAVEWLARRRMGLR